jgi:hypothetical protein
VIAGAEGRDMMRKSVLLIVIATILLFSCDDGSTGSSGSAPVLDGVFISSSRAGLSGSTETTSFRVGDRAWFRFTITDEDLDAKEILVTQKSGSLIFGPNGMSLEKQNAATQYYAGYMDVEYEGTWEISAYCLDGKGNRSNTIKKNLTVTP